MNNIGLRKRVNNKLKILTHRFAKTQNPLLIFLRSGYWLVPISWGLLIVHLSPTFGTAYGHDSFAYYLLGKNLVSGSGYASQAIRDFYLPVTPDFFQPSRSFPPLMPVLVGIVDKLSGKGIVSALLVNIFALLAMFHAHFLFSKRVAAKYFWVVFLVLPLFIFASGSVDSFTQEIVSGRSIPLAALLYTLISLTICRHELTMRRSFFLGILMGMLYLNRFDALAFCVLLMGYIFLEKRTNARWVVFGLLITLAPWLIRNTIVFGNPLASDNFITVFSTFPLIVQISWFDHGVPLLRDHPNLWFTQRGNYVIQNMGIVTRMLGGFVTIMIAAFGLFSENIPKNIKTYIVIAFLWLLSNLMVVSLTPYHDARYFSLSAFVIGLSALLTVISLIVNQPGAQATQHDGEIIGNTPGQKHQWILACASIVLAIWIVNYSVKPRINAGDDNASGYQCLYDELKGEISRSDLVAYGAAEHLAYYSKWRTIYFPLNASSPDSNFISWKTRFNVRYAIVPADSEIAKHPLVTVKRKACGDLLVDLAELKN